MGRYVASVAKERYPILCDLIDSSCYYICLCFLPATCWDMATTWGKLQSVPKGPQGEAPRCFHPGAEMVLDRSNILARLHGSQSVDDAVRHSAQMGLDTTDIGHPLNGLIRRVRPPFAIR